MIVTKGIYFNFFGSSQAVAPFFVLPVMIFRFILCNGFFRVDF